jgi:hypothetical protein
VTAEIENILDICLDRVNTGVPIEACLADYPAQADSLRPLLLTATEAVAAGAFTPSTDAKRAARQRFSAALEARQTQPETGPFWARIFGRPLVWVGAAAVAAVFLIGFLGIYPNLTTTPVIPTADPAGNFQFLISDEPNAIDDFDHVYITIDKIELQGGGSDSVEITPEIMEMDLKPLTGNNALEVWRGDVPPGEYTKVFIYVSEVRGIIAGGGEQNIKLPSSKLQINQTFTISADAVTSFVYDVTVVSAGQKGKYILKPQIGQSGASQPFTEVDADADLTPETPSEKPAGKGKAKS